MIRYRIIANVCFVANGKPEFTHQFVAKVDEREFCRALSDKGGVKRTWPLPEGDGVLRTEIEDMAFNLLMYRNLTPSGMVASVEATRDVVQIGEDIQKRVPDLTRAGIYLWYCGERTLTG